MLSAFTQEPRVAYFSMEIALRNEIPTYAGGLGVLAGDTMRSSADLELPVVAVSLVSSNGYFRQEIDARGNQVERPSPWQPRDWARALDAKIAVEIEARSVWIMAWLYVMESHLGGRIPVLLLDTDLPENAPDDRTITRELYGGDDLYRLKQEVVLGIGGVRMLHALGFDISMYHMNEGHSALLAVELLQRHMRSSADLRTGETPYDIPLVRSLCRFTTHTPVESGHDRFSYDMVQRALGGTVDYTILRYLPGWHHEPELLLRAECCIPDAEIAAAHESCKTQLIALVAKLTSIELNAQLPILGFSRRMTAYKRPDLLFSDLDRLRAIAARHPLQVVLAGKAHPRDDAGKRLIRELHDVIGNLRGTIAIAYLPDYDMQLGMAMVAGADIWLNTPLRPLEASGTSGMKAALNGVPNFSVLDGWWIEGCIEGITGWSIGTTDSARDADSLYDKLEKVVLPLFHQDPAGWVRVMKGAISKNASYFHSHRMMRRYGTEAYLR